MFFIPGIVITFVTFPGVVVHEFAHMLFCRLRKVAVFDVCYLQFENPAGYVIHEPIENFQSTFLVAMGPFFVNTALALALAIPTSVSLQSYNDKNPWFIFVMWLAVSIAMHAIPSNQDVKNVHEAAKKHAKNGNVLAILSFPLVFGVYVFNLFRVLWSDAIYAALICYIFADSLANLIYF